MKLRFLLISGVVLLMHCTEYAESGSVAWITKNIFEKLSNKTSEIKNFVKQKGYNLKQLFKHKVKNKINAYLDTDSNESGINNIGKQNDRIKRKFKNYAESREETIPQDVIDFMTSDSVEYKHNDYDPKVNMSTPQLIALHGYSAESHTVITDDGYMLTIHRIPRGRNTTNNFIPRKTVILHHCLLGSSADWVMPGPDKGLAYVLSDAGYDVWMANVRGNTYSRAHVSRSIDSFAFWNFTWHDISQHDLPAVIDYIMDVKGWDVKINYIGHSMGTTVLFAMLSTKLEYNKILRAGFALAPVAYMSNIKSPIRMLAKYSNKIEYLMKLLGANELLPQTTVLKWLSKYTCEISEELICENPFFSFYGYNERQFNRSLLPIILGHVPAGASTKTLLHYGQEIHNEGRFQQFDYGPRGNLERYDAVTPPEYPLHKITLPIALFSAKRDWLAGEVDVANLYMELANPIDHYIVPVKEFNHIDFLWAVDAPKLVYSKLLQLLEEGVSESPYL